MDFKKVIKNTIFLGASTVGAMHCINKIIYKNSDSKSNSIFENEHYYNWKHGNVFYTMQGHGNPILLIHDLDVCSSSYEWNHVIHLLSQTNTVYSIDLPGCGQSDKSNLIYTNYLYVTLINSFIENVIKTETSVIATGHSSALAVMSFQDNNTFIKDLILVNPEDVVFSSGISKRFSEFLKILFYIPVIGKFVYNSVTNKETIKKKFCRKYYYNLEKVTSDKLMKYYEASQKDNTKGKNLYSSFLCGFMDYNIINTLKNVSKKISIIVGSSDADNIKRANHYKDILPTINIKKLEQTKYLPQLEAPERFITLLQDLL